MQAGALRHRLAIQAPTTAIDQYGEAIKVWSTVATVWGSVEPLRMQEYFEAQQTQAKATHRLTLRYLPGVTSAYRVAFGIRTFEVTAVLNPEERHAQLQLLAVEMPSYGSL